MVIYTDIVFLINFSVDFLLLLGTNRLTGFPPGYRRCLFAACMGGIYGCVCLFHQLAFLGSALWRTVSLLLICLIAFGWNRSAVSRGSIYILLSMALGGISMGVPAFPAAALFLASSVLGILCITGFRSGVGKHQYVPITLRWENQELTVIALKDTGNTLTDPLTGEQVLIAGADIGTKLLGLTPDKLSDPISALGVKHIPGARLIPYHAVGQPGGLLLAVRFHNVKIDGHTIHPLVAFAPNVLAKGEIYQMLTGGVIS